MTEPLRDVVVLDLSRALAGPHAAMMLGDLGARVIKVESPAGDEARGWGPPFVTDSDGSRQSTYFLSCNRNKESVTLDLKTTIGKDTLRRLIVRSDVLVENFRTGVLARLGFSMETLHQINPRLVILSITGFGHDGPEGGRAGYDQIAQGEAGLMSLTGPNDSEPTKVGVPITDLLAGIYGAFGVVSALVERTSSGRGQVVRTSLLAAAVGVHAYQGTRTTVAGEVPGASGNHHPSIAPYGLFRTADAPVQVAVGSQGLWDVFAAVVGIDPGDARFASNADRVRHRAELTGIIEDAFSRQGAEHWLKHLAAAGVPAGKVRTLDDVYRWEQTRSQGLVVEVDHPTLGTISLPGPPIRVDDNIHAGGRVRHHPPPLLGADNESVMAWLDACESRAEE